MVRGSRVDLISGVARVWRTIPTPGARIAKGRNIVLQTLTNTAILSIEHEFGRNIANEDFIDQLASLKAKKGNFLKFTFFFLIINNKCELYSSKNVIKLMVTQNIITSIF